MAAECNEMQGNARAGKKRRRWGRRLKSRRTMTLFLSSLARLSRDVYFILERLAPLTAPLRNSFLTAHRRHANAHFECIVLPFTISIASVAQRYFARAGLPGKPTIRTPFLDLSANLEILAV